jgi:hypothetical protein
MEVLQVLGAGGPGNLADAFASVLDITLPSCGATPPAEAAAEANSSPLPNARKRMASAAPSLRKGH